MNIREKIEAFERLILIKEGNFSSDKRKKKNLKKQIILELVLWLIEIELFNQNL